MIVNILFWGVVLLGLGLLAFAGMVMIENRKQNKIFKKAKARLLNLERLILPLLDELIERFNENSSISGVYRLYSPDLGVTLERRGHTQSELILTLDEIEDLKGNIPLRVQKFYLMCATGRSIDIRNDDESIPRWHTINDYSQEYEDALKGEEIMEKLK